MAIKKTKLSFLSVVIGLIVALSFTVGTPRTAEAKIDIITILLCPLGCGPTEGDTILGGLIAREDPTFLLRAQETPGYTYNLREMATNPARWDSNVFGTNDDTLNFGPLAGQPPFDEFLGQEPLKEKFMLLYGEAWWTQGHWWVTLDPNLKSIADLKGKRLGIGLRTQSDWGMNARIDLEFGYGITPENTRIHHLGPAKSVEELLAGKVDAIAMGMGAEPTFTEWLIVGPMRTLEASGRKLYYIGIEEEILDKLNEKFGTAYLPVPVPANTLKDQDEEFIAGADRGYKAAHHTFPEELAYRLVMAVAKHGPEMRELHGLWRIMSPELMLHGLTETNTHPGALRAYKELGWWDDRPTELPVVLWWEEE